MQIPDKVVEGLQSIYAEDGYWNDLSKSWKGSGRRLRSERRVLGTSKGWEKKANETHVKTEARRKAVHEKKTRNSFDEIRLNKEEDFIHREGRMPNEEELENIYNESEVVFNSDNFVSRDIPTDESSLAGLAAAGYTNDAINVTWENVVKPVSVNVGNFADNFVKGTTGKSLSEAFNALLESEIVSTASEEMLGTAKSVGKNARKGVMQSISSNAANQSTSFISSAVRNLKGK